jgi:hypothetical protein
MPHRSPPEVTHEENYQMWPIHDDPEVREITFGNVAPLPPGWHVIQLDSGHYMGVHEDDIRETSITVNRFHARKWCFDAAARDCVTSEGAQS